ncbi:MAG: DUF1015 family protein [Chitinophagales bacterium]|nr:DUF1015 family protein [Chitinophagales bacterium]MDW8418390.1 DUF1015 family protein [Chitinophagales bacterium]
MAVIRPFRALRPQPALAAKVASLPYDVMNSQEAAAMAAGNPYSFLHVSRAEIDLPPGTDEHSPEVYQKANENFKKLIHDRVLIQDEMPLLYLYSQTMHGREQVGLVACCSIDDYFQNIIKKHEFTRPDKEEDRIRHTQALQAHVGLIFLTYPENRNVSAIVQQVMQSRNPVYDFTSGDQIRHKVWIIDDPEKIETIVRIFRDEIPFTYIADGHHRTASAAKVGLRLREQNPQHTGNEEYNFFQAALFPHTHLAIMDYNRVVRDLNGWTPEEFLHRLSEKFEVSPPANVILRPGAIHEFTMYLENKWYRLRARPHIIRQDPIGVLDVTILQENVLEPLLGIRDPRTDKRIDFVGGIRGLEELQRRVNSGEMRIAFALYPVSLKQLMDIADSGNVMPPKSTWFEPKLRDGLFCHLF